MDKSSILTIESDGNLVIKASDNTNVWWTNITPSTSGNSTASLEDNGDLILKNIDSSNNSRDVWKSFDNPGDTFLPGMRVGLDLNTGVTQLLKSWKSEDDPSPGNYSLGIDPDQRLQIVMWKGPNRWWRSGQWNGQYFTGIINMRPLSLYGFQLINDDEQGKIYVSYTLVESSTFLRFVTKWDGKEEELQWEEGNRTWSVIWSQPISECETYGKCGKNGVCSENGGESICSCLRGFEPMFGEEWRKGNWSGGCKRRTELGCARNESIVDRDGFLTVEHVKLPDFAAWEVVSNGETECRAICLANCSCNAYAFDSGIGCLIWGRDLIDIRTFSDGGNELHLRLARSELGDSSKISKKILIIIIIVLGVFFSLCACVLWRWRAKLVDLWKKEKKEDKKEEIPVYDFRPSRDHSIGFSGPSDLGEEQGKNPELPMFNFGCIALATDNFSDENKLGEGGFGPVYKAKLLGGEEVAVKRLSKSSGQGLEEFKNEIILIAKLQHRNLVRLLGCCIHEDERMLLYEYMSNKSLDVFLFDSTKQSLLDWTKRFNIIEGIARGLLYLHRDSRLRIIHRDLKASNILLDEEMSPKISDFGMARIFGGNQNQANTNRVVGTYGYMSPEYAMEGLFSVKSDVYSFGVLVLEIVSGKKNTNSRNHDEDSMNLVGDAWKLWNEGRTMELVDPSIANSCSRRQVLRCIHVGLLCVQDSPIDRPNMSSVLLMLESETTIYTNPKPPTFSVGLRHSREIEPYITSERFSTNDTTVTMVIGR